MGSALLFYLLLACTASGGPGDLVCTASVNPTIETVIGVEWTAPEGAVSSVVFGETESYGFVTPSTSETEVHRDLIGVPADTDVYWRATSTTEAGDATCEGVTHTGDLPSDLPTLTVESDGAGQDAAQFAIGAFFEGAGGRGSQTQLVAFRRDGEVVWYYEGDSDATSLDMHYSRDGRGILFNQYGGPMGDEGGVINLVSLTGELLQTWDAPYAHHMFAELPDGTLAYQQVDIRPYTTASGATDDWVGDAIAEIPAGGGDAKVVFSIWDVLTPSLNDRMERSIYAGLDWTHGNNLRYEEDRGGYLLSLGHADDLVRFDRETAEVTGLWGADGAPADPAFDYQHDVHALANGNLLMFMSETSGAGAIEYAVTDEGLSEVWRGPFGRAPFALGQARRLANGNTFVNGGAGQPLYEVTPDRVVVWEVSVSGGPAVFGQFQLVEDLYTGAAAVE